MKREMIHEAALILVLYACIGAKTYNAIYEWVYK